MWILFHPRYGLIRTFALFVLAILALDAFAISYNKCGLPAEESTVPTMILVRNAPYGRHLVRLLKGRHATNNPSVVDAARAMCEQETNALLIPDTTHLYDMLQARKPTSEYAMAPLGDVGAKSDPDKIQNLYPVFEFLEYRFTALLKGSPDIRRFTQQFSPIHWRYQDGNTSRDWEVLITLMMANPISVSGRELYRQLKPAADIVSPVLTHMYHKAFLNHSEELDKLVSIQPPSSEQAKY